MDQSKIIDLLTHLQNRAPLGLSVGNTYHRIGGRRIIISTMSHDELSARETTLPPMVYRNHNGLRTTTTMCGPVKCAWCDRLTMYSNDSAHRMALACAEHLGLSPTRGESVGYMIVHVSIPYVTGVRVAPDIDIFKVTLSRDLCSMCYSFAVSRNHDHLCVGCTQYRYCLTFTRWVMRQLGLLPELIATISQVYLLLFAQQHEYHVAKVESRVS